MTTEFQPLLSRTSTGQSYLAFSESTHPNHHSSHSIQRISSFSQSIREVEEDGHQQTLQPNEPLIFRTSSIDTLHDNMNESHSKKHQHPASFISRITKLVNLFSTSLYLENNMAVARDHLANERTFLAWVRTSLSTISIGVAITQLFRLDKNAFKDPEAAEDLIRLGKPLGLSFIMIGIFYMIFALTRYFHTQTALTKGYFPASRSIVIISSTATLAALVSVFIVILQKN